MRALIVDDERLARAELRRLLADFSQIEIVGEAVSVTDAREAIARLEPDLLFLDVEMPDGTGFDLLASLEEVPLVIFSTAYDAHAVRAFEVNALDYLLKPVEKPRLQAAVGRALQKAQAAAGQPRQALERVFVRDGERCWLVQLSEVPLIEAEGNFARLHLPSAQPLLARSLQYLEDRLDPKTFFRASRRQLINLAQVERLSHALDGRLIAELKGGAHVELSRRQSQRFKERMSP